MKIGISIFMILSPAGPLMASLQYKCPAFETNHLCRAASVELYFQCFKEANDKDPQHHEYLVDRCLSAHVNQLSLCYKTCVQGKKVLANDSPGSIGDAEFDLNLDDE